MSIIKLPTNFEGQSRAHRLRTTVSDKYQTVDTVKLVDRLRDSFSNYLDIDDGTIKRGPGTIHAVTVPIKTGTTMRGDIIQPNITFINSFNGECALKLNIGFMRLVCFNGLQVGEALFTRNVRHVHGQKLTGFLNSFESDVADTLGQIDSVLQDIEEVTSKPITPTDAVSIIHRLRDSKVVTVRAAEVAHLTYVTNRFRRPEDKAQANTLFGLWNILNEELEQQRSKQTTAFSLMNRNNKLLPAIIAAAATAEASDNAYKLRQDKLKKEKK
jgi:hypothetical protein